MANLFITIIIIKNLLLPFNDNQVFKQNFSKLDHNIPPRPLCSKLLLECLLFIVTLAFIGLEKLLKSLCLLFLSHLPNYFKIEMINSY